MVVLIESYYTGNIGKEVYLFLYSKFISFVGSSNLFSVAIPPSASAEVTGSRPRCSYGCL